MKNCEKIIILTFSGITVTDPGYSDFNVNVEMFNDLDKERTTRDLCVYKQSTEPDATNRYLDTVVKVSADRTSFEVFSKIVNAVDNTSLDVFHSVSPNDGVVPNDLPFGGVVNIHLGVR